MARRGTLDPDVKLQPFLANGTTPRCQFVKKELEGKKYGEQCKKASSNGRPRCKYHGAYAGRPIITGEHSKYSPLPTGLRDKFAKAVTDPDLLNLTNKIALFDAQIWQLCEDAQAQSQFTPRQTRKLITLVKSHKSLVKQETDRRVAMGTMLDVRQVMMIINYLYNSIEKNVQDKSAKRKIANDLRSILANPGLMTSNKKGEGAVTNEIVIDNKA